MVELIWVKDDVSANNGLDLSFELFRSTIIKMILKIFLKIGLILLLRLIFLIFPLQRRIFIKEKIEQGLKFYSLLYSRSSERFFNQPKIELKITLFLALFSLNQRIFC